MLYLLSGSELVEFDHHQVIYTFSIAISMSKEHNVILLVWIRTGGI